MLDDVHAGFDFGLAEGLVGPCGQHVHPVVQGHIPHATQNITLLIAIVLAIVLFGTYLIADLGGRIFKNKTLFYASWGGQRRAGR